MTNSVQPSLRNRSERIPGLEPCLIRFGARDSRGSRHNALPIASSRTEDLTIEYDVDESLPGYDSNTDCAVIFDGWLHNREAFDSTFAPDADANDAAIIRKAYMMEGEKIFSKLSGTFFLVIFDIKKNVLLCVRDRFGSFSIFFSDTGKELLFSSSIDTLLKHPRVSKKINRVAAAEHLSNRWFRLDETYYEKIHRIPPAHALRRENGRSDIYRYWDPFPEGAPTEWLKEEDLDRFDGIFEKTVARRLDPGRTAIFLSGGLDSVSIASVAADLTQRNGHPDLLALSLVFPHPECNERELQESVADQLNFDKHLLPFESVYQTDGLLQKALEVSRDWPLPPLAPWKVGYSALAQQAYARGYRSILSGDGGDEWLTVHPNYLADLIRDWNYPEAVRVLRNFMRSHGLPRLAHLRFLIWKCGFHPLLRSYLGKAAPELIRKRRTRRVREHTRPWVSSDPELRNEIHRRLDRFVDESLKEPIPPKGYGYYFSGFPHVVTRTLSSMGMEESFEIGRRTGVWLQKPFYDAELVDFLLRIPPHLLQRGGREKGMVRQSVAKRFPGLKFEKQRKTTALGFLNSMLRTEGPAAWKRMGGAKALTELGIIDQKLTEETILRSFQSSDLRNTCVVWELLNLESWIRPRV